MVHGKQLTGLVIPAVITAVTTRAQRVWLHSALFSTGDGRTEKKKMIEVRLQLLEASRWESGYMKHIYVRILWEPPDIQNQLVLNFASVYWIIAGSTASEIMK